jgi:TAT (twin-arginine translocation) pathway signal sequence
MSSEKTFPTVLRPQTTGSSTSTESNSSVRSTSNRRSFLKHGMVAGAAAAVGTGILARGVPAFADETNSCRTS